ncbi:ABC transporter permease [Alicyclobacillus sp. ALC3]|uniref:ABC transporter permease n=1 Tax=Alicyclobacillus sp. ALC3 TaxID=2796143 RepID=UPI0023787A35|nr:ABC transporter permease [Alicyclobacillus sp. ALC3]WDL98430.1 ABC transporter permease [Alicyclobacillus sp. ALC3]
MALVEPTEELPATVLPSSRPSVLRQMLHQPRALISGGIVILLLLVAILAPVISPMNPDTIAPHGLSPIGAPLPPGTHGFLLGTDELGRDILSRLIWGTQISMAVGIGATLVTLFLGLVVGITAGYYGGRIDTFFMRIADMFLAFPFILFVVFVASIFKPSLAVIILAIGLLGWAPISRIARSRTLDIRHSLFVEAAVTAGASSLRIIVRHVFPNVISTITAYGLLQVGTNIMFESALSYLGAGPPPPTPDWGAMVAEGQGAMATAPWLFFIPGICIMVAVISFNLFGDSWLQATTRRR